MLEKLYPSLPTPQHIYFKLLETGGRWAAEGWNRSKGAKREGSSKDAKQRRRQIKPEEAKRSPLSPNF
ncbi:hypothetical protein MHB85_20040 [Paenibacillus sp. FSL K6-4396]|uniref:hypothetical protein n=1 Tax=Paenibacillus sp. FSL K6-4396 TaxID=2921506 RepID=UPI0030FBDB09